MSKSLREKNPPRTDQKTSRADHETVVDTAQMIYGFRLGKAQVLVDCASGRQERERTVGEQQLRFMGKATNTCKLMGTAERAKS
jgi:hypothetical protein